MKIHIEHNRVLDVVEYCKQNIGPQRAYLHNGTRAGSEWNIARDGHKSWTATLPEDHAIVVALKYSE